MGMESSTPSTSPKIRLRIYRKWKWILGREERGEFEPPDEISLGRLLNNIIVFEVFVLSVVS